MHGSHEHPPGRGHNHSHGHTAQWQTPHLPHGHDHGPAVPDDLRDLDLVEQAFVESFPAASDPTSFLRLAGVRFEGTAPDGRRLVLLRVELGLVADVGSVTPHVGGGSFRYAPLPAKLASKRQRLALAYFDGETVRHLSLSEGRALGEP